MHHFNVSRMKTVSIPAMWSRSMLQCTVVLMAPLAVTLAGAPLETVDSPSPDTAAPHAGRVQHATDGAVHQQTTHFDLKRFRPSAFGDNEKQ